MGGSMTELNMKNKKQPLIAKIVDVSFVCIVILLMMASLSTLVIGSFFQENEKNGILAYELQQLYIIPNAEPKEFNFNNVWYVNKNMLHCSVDNVSKDYKLTEALEKMDGARLANIMLKIIWWQGLVNRIKLLR